MIANLLAAVAMFWFLLRRRPKALARLKAAWSDSVTGSDTKNGWTLRSGEEIVDTAIRNLARAECLLRSLDGDSYSNSSIGPYYSSIGGHLRHVLDVFACVIRGVDSGIVDLTDRRRGTLAETDPDGALDYLDSVTRDLSGLRGIDLATPVTIVDDLGSGRTEIPATLGAGLCQAHSHAIHHFACIGYLLHLQGLELPDRGFGYNPTTPPSPTAPGEGGSQP